MIQKIIIKKNYIQVDGNKYITLKPLKEQEDKNRMDTEIKGYINSAFDLLSFFEKELKYQTKDCIMYIIGRMNIEGNALIKPPVSPEPKVPPFNPDAFKGGSRTRRKINTRKKIKTSGIKKRTRRK